MHIRATSYYKTSRWLQAIITHSTHKTEPTDSHQSSLTYNNEENKLHQTLPDFTFIIFVFFKNKKLTSIHSNKAKRLNIIAHFPLATFLGDHATGARFFDVGGGTEETVGTKITNSRIAITLATPQK